MVPTVQRRRHCRWRMFVVLLLSLVRHSVSAPTNSETTVSTAPPRRPQDIGSPSELAWQAWLLVDAQTGAHSGLESASLLRRITPKSVFIAPALPACAEGYRADTMGRCVKNVNIDHEAHIDFLLQRLNAMYANRDSASSAAAFSSSNDQKQSSGPLQLNIPLLSNSGPQSKSDHDETGDSAEVPILIPQESANSEEKKKPQEPIITVYEVKNDTAVDEEETMNSEEKKKLQEAIITVYEVKNDTALDEEETTNSEEKKKSQGTIITVYEVKNDTALDEEETTNSEEKKKSQGTIITVYEVKNDTALDDEETTFFLRNDSAVVTDGVDQDAPTEPDSVVPVADFVDESVESSEDVRNDQPHKRFETFITRSTCRSARRTTVQDELTFGPRRITHLLLLGALLGP